ncbi:hypothetical protein K8T06_13380 [bacterium]|nr:hypothetical protein [bacterium]
MTFQYKLDDNAMLYFLKVEGHLKMKWEEFVSAINNQVLAGFLTRVRSIILSQYDNISLKSRVIIYKLLREVDLLDNQEFDHRYLQALWKRLSVELQNDPDKLCKITEAVFESVCSSDVCSDHSCCKCGKDYVVKNTARDYSRVMRLTHFVRHNAPEQTDYIDSGEDQEEVELVSNLGDKGIAALSPTGVFRGLKEWFWITPTPLFQIENFSADQIRNYLGLTIDRGFLVCVRIPASFLSMAMRPRLIDSAGRISFRPDKINGDTGCTINLPQCDRGAPELVHRAIAASSDFFVVPCGWLKQNYVFDLDILYSASQTLFDEFAFLNETEEHDAI